MIVVVFEDRPQALAGAKLATLSLTRHCPEADVLAWVPGAPESFQTWARTVPGLRVRTHRRWVEGNGWNVKPSVLLRLLQEKNEQVVWVDSDIIVTGDLLARLRELPADALIAAQEYFWGHHQGTDLRTTGLGLQTGRVFPATVNSCVLRVLPEHESLLRRWSAILAGPDYTAVQGCPARRRPVHYWGDQDVLAGLLGAKDFADLPVVQLRRGADIAQCFGPSGYTVRERILAGRRLPLVLHAMGEKPWTLRSRPRSGFRGYLTRAHLELTPYTRAAREYRDLLGENTVWMVPTTAVGKVMVSSGLPLGLQELPLAVVDSAQRRFRRRFGLGRVGSLAGG
jgi:hypothetical protein